MQILDKEHNIYFSPINVKNNTLDYGHVWKNGVKLSDEIFRIGGLGGKFKGNYCDLIYYSNIENYSRSEIGQFVIIDREGNIVFKADPYKHPYLMGGCVVSYESCYYNLKTGDKICSQGYNDIKSTKSIYVHHKFQRNDIEIGVYKIDLETCTLSKIEDV